MLENIIKEYKEGKISLLSQQVISKEFYSRGNKIKPRVSTYYYAINKKGQSYVVNKKYLDMFN